MGSPTRQPSISRVDDKNESSFVEDVELKETGKGAVDDVVAMYNSYTPEFSAEVERKLVRMIGETRTQTLAGTPTNPNSAKDMRIMPLVVIIYIFSYLDRNSVGFVTTLFWD